MYIANVIKLAIARGFKPMAAAPMQALHAHCGVYAVDGRFDKSSKKFADGGRIYHGFPPQQLET